jgi:hypothetical protein
MATATAIHNIGKVVQVIGPVLDVEFEAEHLPELYNALEITAKSEDGTNIRVVAEVQQHIGRNQVRAVAMSTTDSVVRGMEVVDMGGPISVPVGKPALGRILNVLGDPVTSSAPIRSASCSSAALAPARCAPSPATISGLRLCRTSATAASIACGRGAAGAGAARFGAGPVALAARSISASWTLTGSSSAAAPPCIAAAAASARAPRAVAGLVATKVRMPAAPSTPVALKPL